MVGQFEVAPVFSVFQQQDLGVAPGEPPKGLADQGLSLLGQQPAEGVRLARVKLRETNRNHVEYAGDAETSNES